MIRGRRPLVCGLYSIVRIIFMGLYASSMDRYTQYLVQQILCTFIMFLFAVLRPYKVEFYNVLDCSFFGLLAILNSLSFFNYSYWVSNHHLQEAVFYVNYLLVFLPAVYLIVLIVYLLLSWRGCCSCVSRKSSSGDEIDYDEKSAQSDEDGVNSSEVRSTLDTDRLLPDRMVNPHNYRTLDRMSSINSSGSFVSVQQQQRGGGGGGGGGGRGAGQRDRQPSTDQPHNQHHPRVHGVIQWRDGDRATA